MTDARRGPSRMRPLWALLAAMVVLSACSGGNNTTSSGGGGQVTLNTIWMKQAAYSDDEVKAMIKAFEDANPNIKVKYEFVQYESLHDKIITAQSQMTASAWIQLHASGYFTIPLDLMSLASATTSSHVLGGLVMPACWNIFVL